MKTALVNGQPQEMPDEVQYVIPGPGIDVQMPGYFEINGTTTLEFCKQVDVLKIAFILKAGGIFDHLFRLIFDNDSVPIPRSYDQLQAAGNDVRHVTGLICLFFEAKCERGENIFLREPETWLHPQQTVGLMTLVNALNKLPMP